MDLNNMQEALESIFGTSIFIIEKYKRVKFSPRNSRIRWKSTLHETTIQMKVQSICSTYAFMQRLKYPRGM